MTDQLKQEIDSIVSQLVAGYNPEKIILFGSAARGEATEGSDVDLFIIKKGVDDLPRIDRSQSARTLFKSKTPVDILVYTPFEVQKRLFLTDPFVKNIVENGTVLYGS